MIKLYGAERCHKTQYYKTFFETRNLNYAFLDVELNKENAEELRNLYKNRKLNFPTITIGKKKLRNPTEKELIKQLKMMNLIKNIKNYFKAKSAGNTTTKAPEGICPNCWGKQEWEGEFYKKIKVNNVTSENNTYNSFVHEIAEKLDKITLKEDILICETCKTSFK